MRCLGPGVGALVHANRLLISALLLTACAPTRAPSPPMAPPAIAADPAPESPPEVAAPAPHSPANLLDIVSAKIAVSSTVVNPRDFPEHLVDGRPETAWNSRTGDLRGWIAFRVPRDARVDRIEITCGYDRVKGREDLFTANHRITRVAITRDGQLVKEAALDPNVRGLQAIAIDGGGGDYRISVLDTVPGTKKEWRELVVSELRVVGRPGKETRRVDEPVRVAVGDLDAEPDGAQRIDQMPAVEHTYASVASLCAAYVAAVTKRRAELPRKEDVGAREPSCREIKSPASIGGAGPYKSLRAVRLSDGIAEGNSLVVEGAGGFALTPVAWDWVDPDDPGCPSIVRGKALIEARVDNGYLVVVVAGERSTMVEPTAPDDAGWRGQLVRTVFWAKDEGKGLVFRYYDPQFNPSLGEKMQPRPKRLPWESIPWEHVRPFHIAPDGSLRIQG
jgi:hypothetical protein